MGFMSLLIAASMPILQFLLIGMLGSFLASSYSNILSHSARSHINKITFVVFTPALAFACLAKTVTLGDLISWWFMPINIGLTYLFGEFLGWAANKILRPKHHLEPLIIATCSTGNLGSLPLIIVPALCDELNSPFGNRTICQAQGLSYVALSMSLGNIFIWTRTYSVMKRSLALYNEIDIGDRPSEVSNKESEGEASIIKIQGEGGFDDCEVLAEPSIEPSKDDGEHGQRLPLLSSSKLSSNKLSLWDRVKGIIHKTVELLLEPPVFAAIIGLIFGVIPWLKSLVIGDTAPLRVIQDSLVLLGNGVIPCSVLILGGNLMQGLLHKTAVRPSVIIAIILVRYVMLPLGGIAVVRAAGELGFLPKDPLYCYVLLLQFALPPAFSIGTMTQLFDVGKEECSFIFLWTYLAGAFGVTAWSTVFVWLLTK